MFNTMPLTMPVINFEKVGPLAVASLQRSPLRKDLPTLNDASRTSTCEINMAFSRRRARQGGS
jgi:hypothetical protein